MYGNTIIQLRPRLPNFRMEKVEILFSQKDLRPSHRNNFVEPIIFKQIPPASGHGGLDQAPLNTKGSLSIKQKTLETRARLLAPKQARQKESNQCKGKQAIQQPINQSIQQTSQRTIEQTNKRSHDQSNKQTSKQARGRRGVPKGLQLLIPKKK